MMTRILSIVVAIALYSVPAAAEEQKGAGFLDWIKSLQKKISQVQPKKSVGMTNSVAGVRGAKEDAAVKLYWKGKKGDEPVTEEELAKFKETLECVSKGDKGKAVHGLQEFMKTYPDSALIPDAKKTLDIVLAEMPDKPGDEGKKEEQKQK
jgi:TolA-binding protein